MMKLIIDAPRNRMVEAAMLFGMHGSDQQPIGIRHAKHYGHTANGVYEITWAIWRTKVSFLIRYLGSDKGSGSIIDPRRTGRGRA